MGMKIFNSTCEVALTKEDVMSAIEFWLNNRMRSTLNCSTGYDVTKYIVGKITIHKDAKYLLRADICQEE